MVTIKEIAKNVGLSPSTVSIVLSGKAEQRNISPLTVTKVRQAAANLGYVPNAPAIRLRMASSVPVYRILIFWTADFRESVMLRFIKKIEDLILDQTDVEFEVLLKVYRNNYLKEAMTDDTIRSSHGAIICNASAADMRFVESNEFPRPVVLYNRHSSRYPTVTLDDNLIGLLPAKAFARQNCKHPAIIYTPSTYGGMDVRRAVFDQTCVASGMVASVNVMCGVEIGDGYQATKELMKNHPEIDSVFYTSDSLAMGGLRYFHDSGTKIPDQVKLISLAYGSPKNTEMTIPSLSIVDIPVEKAAARCLNILTKMVRYEEYDPSDCEALISEYVPRESCPEG